MSSPAYEMPKRKNADPPPPTETLINFLIWNATQCMTTSFLLPEVS